MFTIRLSRLAATETETAAAREHVSRLAGAQAGLADWTRPAPTIAVFARRATPPSSWAVFSSAERKQRWSCRLES